jgi:hypothetical protein
VRSEPAGADDATSFAYATAIIEMIERSDDGQLLHLGVRGAAGSFDHLVGL